MTTRLSELRVKYNQLLSHVALGTPERKAYLDICYTLRQVDEKRKAISKVRGYLKTTEDDAARQIYTDALNEMGGNNVQTN